MYGPKSIGNAVHQRRLRILTYNVHGCRGRDGVIDPARIAEVIARCDADIIGLQELDVGRKRSGGVDQAMEIAAHLRMGAYFHPAMSIAEEQYGDAILTALPISLVKAGALPSRTEPRGAIWISVEIEGAMLHVINTHLGLRRRERLSQVEALLGKSWLGQVGAGDANIVLMGDFNSIPSSAAYRQLAREMTDVQSATQKRPSATYPSRLPWLRLDHIFVDPGLSPATSKVETTALARAASDHLPLHATVEIPTAKPATINGSKVAAHDVK